MCHLVVLTARRRNSAEASELISTPDNKIREVSPLRRVGTHIQVNVIAAILIAVELRGSGSLGLVLAARGLQDLWRFYVIEVGQVGIVGFLGSLQKPRISLIEVPIPVILLRFRQCDRILGFLLG